uniref:Uncharacterized protein n=1 Tax=Aegilops tauschii subsp. strangulata TaxID=200361 RepID=A0A453S9V5_AEGTS
MVSEMYVLGHSKCNHVYLLLRVFVRCIFLGESCTVKYFHWTYNTILHFIHCIRGSILTCDN